MYPATTEFVSIMLGHKTSSLKKANMYLFLIQNSKYKNCHHYIKKKMFPALQNN